ncbi:MAG: guanylate kinase [Flavobacteriales bacterium]|nr:guanylate kinase [Flavobacteriales bacterium]
MEGKCIIFSAPSGAGKTTIVHHLLSLDLGLEFSVSACSRAMRHNEKNGVDYYFLSVEEFKSKISQNAFIEWEEVYTDNFYGTLKSEIERIWSHGKHVIFDVDVVGGLNLKKAFGHRALSIFVKAPSLAHLEERLKSRSTETPESIARRMGKAEKEMAYSEKFDHVLLNDNLERAFAEAEQVVRNFLQG